MAEVTLKDELARSAIQATLWRRISEIIEHRPEDGHTFGDEAWECSDRFGEGSDVTSDALIFDTRMAEIAACRHDIDKIADAEFGETLELSLSTREVVKTAMGISAGIAEDERFWDREPSTRAQVVAIYDALQALVAGLTESAGAVA